MILYFPRHLSSACLASQLHLQSSTLCLKESCRAQPTTANSQHLVQAGAVRSNRLDRGSAPVDAAWQLVASDCRRCPHRVLSKREESKLFHSNMLDH